MTLKFLTFNIEGFTSDRGPQFDWNYRIDANNYIIKKYDPTIICLQEAEKQNIEFYSNKFPNYEILIGLPIYLNKNNKTIYNPILWKKTLIYLEKGGFYLSKTPYKASKSWKAESIRCANWVKLFDKESKVKFFLVNIHLDSSSEEARVESSKLIIKNINILQSYENLPVILTGDFNSRPWAPHNENADTYPPTIISSALPLPQKVYNVYLDNGFTDTYFYKFKKNMLDMNTYHDYYGINFPSAALRIDWILKKDDKKIFQELNYLIITDSLDFVYPSDHYPVLAELGTQ